MDYKYVDLIIKLQELADPVRGGYEGEREAAKNRADHLLAKHEISQGMVDLRKLVLSKPHRARRVWTPDPPMTAAKVAKDNNFDPVKWRRWLRAKGIRKEQYDIFEDPLKRARLVSEFRSR